MPALICTEARTQVRESHITGTRAKRACSSARTRAAEATCRRVGACMCAQRGGGGRENGAAMAQGAWQAAVYAGRACLRKLVVRLQTARLICATRSTAASSCITWYVPCSAYIARTAVVFEDDVRLLVLELTQAKQDYVSLRTRQPRHNSWEGAAGPSAQAEQGCCRTTPIQTRLRSFPRMWHNRLTPSKQNASSRPFPSILVTCAYSVQRGSNGWQVAQAAWLSNYSGPP